jgi:hypothetical protein
MRTVRKKHIAGWLCCSATFYMGGLGYAIGDRYRVPCLLYVNVKLEGKLGHLGYLGYRFSSHREVTLTV